MPLELNNFYSREEVHQIFCPGETYTPQAGSWGMHGIVRIPDRDNDFVFFVTRGQRQGDHQFNEYITDDGILFWQSQPRLGFNSQIIQSFINHDELNNVIYLFWRERENEKYEYLGRLKYISHDNQRQNPVYFQWKLIDLEEEIPWGADPEIIETADINDILRITDRPMPEPNRYGTTIEEFQRRRLSDYSLINQENSEIGELGEKIVMKYEEKRLINEGRKDLANKIVHTSVNEGDGAGYDIKSFNRDDSFRYIEVKTTRGEVNTDFFMSSNEVNFSEMHHENYFLYRIYNLRQNPLSASGYIFEGKISDGYNLVAMEYRLSIK